MVRRLHEENAVEYFGVFETGGSIGEWNGKKGLPTIHTPNGTGVLISVFDNQQDAKEHAKSMRKNFGGGYYDYHYYVRKIKQSDADAYFSGKDKVDKDEFQPKLKEDVDFDWSELCYGEGPVDADVIKRAKEFMGPEMTAQYEKERIGLNPLGYGNEPVCARCGHLLDTHNCFSQDCNGMVFYHYVSDFGDEEGYQWRTFCDDCWDKIENLSADEICDRYEPSNY